MCYLSLSVRLVFRRLSASALTNAAAPPQLHTIISKYTHTHTHTHTQYSCTHTQHTSPPVQNVIYLLNSWGSRRFHNMSPHTHTHTHTHTKQQCVFHVFVVFSVLQIITFFSKLPLCSLTELITHTLCCLWQIAANIFFHDWLLGWSSFWNSKWSPIVNDFVSRRLKNSKMFHELSQKSSKSSKLSQFLHFWLKYLNLNFHLLV